MGVGVARSLTRTGAATCATASPWTSVPAHPAGPATSTVAMYSAAPSAATTPAASVSGPPNRFAGSSADAIPRAPSSRISSVSVAARAPSAGRTVTDARYVAPGSANPLTRAHSPRSCPRTAPPQPTTSTAAITTANTAASTFDDNNGGD